MSIIQEALNKVQNKEPVLLPKEEKPAEILSPKKEKTVKTAEEKTAPVKKKAPGANYILTAAFVVLSFFVAKQFLSKPQAPAGTITSQTMPVPAEKAAKAPKPESDLKDAYDLNEPVANIQKSIIFFPAQSDKFKLKGIMHLDKGPKAVVNNSVVVEGDTLDGATILKINRDNVILKIGNSNYRLELK